MRKDRNVDSTNPEIVIRGGPHTAAGKAAVSRNALKHGLTARKHILLDYEDPEAYAQALEGVVFRLQPADELERRLAVRVADCLWRLDRAALVESAAMNYTFQETLATGKEQYPPAQRFERGLVASVNNDLVEPVDRHEARIERRLFAALHELQALQASRLLNLPISPGALHISLSHQLPPAPADGPQ